MDLKTLAFSVGLYLLSGLLNQLLTFKTAEQWHEYVQTSPRGARLLRILRKVGLDLPGLIRMAMPFLVRKLGPFGFKGGTPTP